MIRTKKVCVKCLMPIFDVIPNRPIVGQINSIDLTIDQIRKCIVGKANVREILGDGQYKVLTLSNYDEFDDEPVVEEPVQEVVEREIPVAVEETKIIEPVEEVIEVQEETPVEEPVVEVEHIEVSIPEEIIKEEVITEGPVEEEVIADEVQEETQLEEVVEEAPAPKQNNNYHKNKKRK